MGIINPNSLLSTTPTIPKFYWDVKSQEQRIKVICCLVQQLIDESKDFDATVTELRNALDSAISECKSYTDSEIGELRAQLMLLIEQLESGALAWDVTTGEYKAPTDAARDSFNDVTIHDITVRVLSESDGANEPDCSLETSVCNLEIWEVCVLVVLCSAVISDVLAAMLVLLASASALALAAEVSLDFI